MVGRHALVLALTLAAGAAPARVVHGQRPLVPAGATAARGLPAALPVEGGGAALGAAGGRSRPRAVRHVLIGALAGGALMAAGIAIYLSSGTECTCTPFVFVPAVAGGMAAGATAGYVVYRIRFR